MHGIVLAGGHGTRLNPSTLVLNKHLLPIYDKPMVYFPLSVLMLAGIWRITVVTTVADRPAFERLLGDGSHLGLDLAFREQDAAAGIVDGLRVGQQRAPDERCCLILGDNIFFGPGLTRFLQQFCATAAPGAVATYHVGAPQRYGVLVTDGDGSARDIVEKPAEPPSNWAVTGLYVYDPEAVALAGAVTPSARGEVEITDLNRKLLAAGKLDVHPLPRGYAWLDMGTADDLLNAANYVHTLEARQNLQVSSLEEIAYRRGLISADQLYRLGERLGQTSYGAYLMRLAEAGDLPARP